MKSFFEDSYVHPDAVKKSKLQGTKIHSCDMRRGQFTRGDHGVPTVILEAVVAQDLWFCHAFFVMAEFNNDLNVLQASPLFNNILQEEEGRAICSYTGNDILNPPAVIQVGNPTYFSRVLKIQNRETHHNLRHDLTEHIWGRQLQGGNDNEDEEDEGDKDADVDNEADEGDEDGDDDE
uniref:Uncharacterized protein n=1 Tax=Lactuca sativa TaxID=4236 RepID=A0A9R1X1C4_LACSA|nr:hypothetical protein LSAT_V11C700370060 [Lactuca sativa]